MSDLFYLHDPGLSGVYLGRILLSLLLAFLTGQGLASVYMYTHSGLSYSRNFVKSLVVIPMTVALVMAVLDNNLVTAFSLMGVFAIVRFRNIIRDTLDTVYVMTLIVVGMAAGTQRFLTAVLGAALFCLVQIYLHFSDFGTRMRHDYMLNVRLHGGENEIGTLGRMLKRHALHIQKIQETPGRDDKDSVDLSFRLLLRNPARSGLLLDELKALKFVGHVTGLPAGGEHEL